MSKCRLTIGQPKRNFKTKVIPGNLDMVFKQLMMPKASEHPIKLRQVIFVNLFSTNKH
jgi:hypothetical protein